MVTELDVRGLRCPMPLLKLKQSLHAMEKGQQLKVIATDAGSARDFPVFLEQTGSVLLSMHETHHEFHYHIEK